MNIVCIHCHDAGRSLSPYGHRIATPNLERFAAGSVVFRQAFCAAPTCSPSRAALWTGQSPHQSGMLGLHHRGFSLRHPSRHLAHHLKAAGFHCVLAGIQHLQDPKGPAWAYDAIAEPANSEEATDETSRDRRVALAASAFLRSNPTGPFLLDCGFFYPHRPYPDPAPSAQPGGLLPPAGLPDRAVVREDMAEYHAAAALMDEAFGIVWDALEETGRTRDSLIVFTTDHGIAFPGHKCNLHDTGLGVALMLRFPGIRPAALDAMVSHLDLFPTLCDYAGLPLPDWVQGHTMRPLLEGTAPSIREEVFAEVTFHAAYEPKRAIRTPRFKYIRNFAPERRPPLPNIDSGATKSWMLANGLLLDPPPMEELYDLWRDPVERCNLAASPAHAPELATLRARLEAWMRETEDPLLLGRVDPPEGAQINTPDQTDPTEPTVVFHGALPAGEIEPRLGCSL